MIEIITDSTCDIPVSLLAQNNISVVPQTIIWGNQQYLDRVDIQPQDFYRRLATDPQRPTSSLPRRIDFQNAYQQAASRGAKEILVITVSSAMSGTYQMAHDEAKIVDIPVHVIDSRGPTMSLGWQVLAAARARDAGADLPTILATIEQVQKKLVTLVCMENLEYLQRGGRIGKAAKWIGVRLQVKPLVSINHTSGLVEPVSLARTHKGLVDLMVNRFIDQLDGGKNLHVAVLHGNVQDKAEALARRIQAELNPAELLVNITGPVLGINTGPGALALSGYAEA